jgi:hypothetical protein
LRSLRLASPTWCRTSATTRKDPNEVRILVAWAILPVSNWCFLPYSLLGLSLPGGVRLWSHGPYSPWTPPPRPHPSLPVPQRHAKAGNSTRFQLCKPLVCFALSFSVFSPRCSFSKETNAGWPHHSRYVFSTCVAVAPPASLPGGINRVSREGTLFGGAVHTMNAVDP